MSYTLIKRHWRTDSRWYRAVVQQDPQGNWLFLKVWGGNTNRRGGQEIIYCKSYDEALLNLHLLEKRRRQRGYE